MNTCTQKAYAKINIALKVEGKVGDYHSLDSIVVTVKKYDKIKVTKRKDDKILLTFYGKYAPLNYIQENTNAYKACKAFIEKFNTKGVNIDIERNIISGSGMGGSSCDIAGTLLALKKLFGIKDDVKDIADSLGSDSGYLLTGGFARIQNRGEKVKFYNVDTKWYVILIYAKNGVETKRCFEKFDTLKDDTNINIENVEKAIIEDNFSLLKDNIGNSLTNSAIMLNSEIQENLNLAKSLSPDVYGMTGSGSSVFIVYENYEMASWAYSKLKQKCKNGIDLVETYNPKRKVLIEKIKSVYSIE